MRTTGTRVLDSLCAAMDLTQLAVARTNIGCVCKQMVEFKLRLVDVQQLALHVCYACLV